LSEVAEGGFVAVVIVIVAEEHRGNRRKLGECDSGRMNPSGAGPRKWAHSIAEYWIDEQVAETGLQ